MRILFLSLFLLPATLMAQDLTQYVDPRIGTGDHGHVFVGANVPFGMVNAGPTQLETGWDWCSGYHESGTKIVGFAQTHLSGTGCSDLGDIAIMPFADGRHSLSRNSLATPYCHDNEIVRPGYYSVLLGTDKKVPSLTASPAPSLAPSPASSPASSLAPSPASSPASGGLPAGTTLVEITANPRNAMYRITFPKGAQSNSLVVDLENGVGDRVQHSSIVFTSRKEVVGYRISHGWANEQHCYFAMRFSREFTDFDDSQQHYQEFSFEPSDEPLIVTISLSPVSEFNAQMNMVDDGVTFDEMRREADAAWNRELGRINATFQNDRDRRIFYTAMYHFMVAPQIWDDANGDWRGADNRVKRAGGGWPQDNQYIHFHRPSTPLPIHAVPSTVALSPTGSVLGGFPAEAPLHYLTTLSLWDTYRAAAPLSTIILPEMMPSVAETYLRIFREQGKLPVWHLMSQETNCMVGCPAVPVLSDLLLKGYVRDTTLAWQAMTSSLLMDERGLDDMKRLGYVANDHHGGSLSMSLEYMLADWAAAQAGKAILAAKATAVVPSASAEGLSAEVRRATDYLDHRSRGYKALYDPRVGYLRSKNSHGEFNSIEGFNPAHQTSDYTEGNPWQYLWLVPHDVEGLTQLLGGRERALQRLDSLFAADSQLNADANPDISGLIGQYAHGNEPSHHIAYLYALMGQPRKTAALVHQIQRELYTDQPAGLCGNEDVGQMSAWYILSALGFYQVEPCGGRYVIGSPLAKEATLHVGGGKTFTIRTHGLSEQAIYVKRVLLNGQPLQRKPLAHPRRGEEGAFILNHADIMCGGTLDIYMTK
ncbi:MAG: GH92 family glycosyl hydrolase [Bacteroidaceae bacterium]|nr:GH92 family glycosyl hydrolase [Bacteroidaceae bacterium]